MFTVIALVFTLQDVRDAKCDTACKRDGYSLGRANDKNCECVDVFKFVEMTGRFRDVPRAEPGLPSKTYF